MARRTPNRPSLEVIPEFKCGRFRLRLGVLPYPRYGPDGRPEVAIGIQETSHNANVLVSVEDAEDYYQALGAAIAYWREHGHMVVGARQAP